MSASTIRCFWTCHGCGVDKRFMNVPERVDGQDVAEWMDSTVRLMGLDHAARSPHCKAGKLDVGIPHGGEDTPIGKKPLS